MTDYAITTSDTTATITPAVSDASATVNVNGVATDSGNTSAAIALVESGVTEIVVRVTAEDGSTQDYTVSITRQSTDATLSGLVTSAGTLDPIFEPSTFGYTIVTSEETTTVTPTVGSVTASCHR